MTIDKLTSFIKVFGSEGQSDRFKGCTAKNGDICNGEYKVYNNIIYYTYEDENGKLYDSYEVPSRIVNLGALSKNITIGKHIN